MKTISISQFDGTTAQLQQRVSAFAQAVQAHAATVGVPAPREEDWIEELARSGIAFQVEAAPVVAPGPVPTFAQLRVRAKSLVDGKAGEVRARYITVVVGQEATYLLKERQAEAFKAAGYAGAVPAMIQAEVDATGLGAQAACDAVLVERDFWVAKAAAIEKERRAGKLALDAVADANVQALEAIRDAALQALDAL